MATIADNVRVAVTGGVYVAPVGTMLATNATVALNAAFDEAGYVTEDGVQQSIDQSVTTLRAWQNADPVRHIETSHSLMYEIGLYETNPVVLEEFFGNFAGNTGGGTEAVQIRSGLLPFRSWTINVVDGAVAGRIVIPKARIVSRGDVQLQNAEGIVFPVTLEAFPDAAGVKAYMYGLIPD